VCRYYESIILRANGRPVCNETECPQCLFAKETKEVPDYRAVFEVNSQKHTAYEAESWQW